MLSAQTIRNEIAIMQAHIADHPDADPGDVTGWQREIAAWQWALDGHYDREQIAGKLVMADTDPDTALALAWVLGKED